MGGAETREVSDEEAKRNGKTRQNGTEKKIDRAAGGFGRPNGHRG
jgi:hypothetical protein